jgi:homoserine kinase type II
MSVFTRVDIHDAIEFLARYDCGDFIDLIGIEQGVTNSNYLLKTAQDEYILTVYEQMDRNSLSQIQKLQSYLHDHGIPCARILPNKQGTYTTTLYDKPAALLEKLNGNIDYSISSNLCHEIGLVLAHLHLLSPLEFFSVPNPRGLEWIFSTVQELQFYVTLEDAEILEQELEYLSRFSKLSLPAGAIHADLFPDNVLVQNDKLVGIIDFDYACHEIFLFDIGVCINAWCSNPDGSLNRMFMRDLLSAYVSLRPLNEEENLSIPMMLRVSALRFWLSRLQDLFLVEPQEMIQHKNPDEFKQILIHRRKRLSGMQR